MKKPELWIKADAEQSRREIFREQGINERKESIHGIARRTAVTVRKVEDGDRVGRGAAASRQNGKSSGLPLSLRPLAAFQ